MVEDGRPARPREGETPVLHRPTPIRLPPPIIDKILRRSLAAPTRSLSMKFFSLMAGGFVLLAAAFTVPAISPSSRSQRRKGLFLHHLNRATLDRYRRRPAAGEVLQINASSGENCDPAGVSGCRKHWPSRSLGARRSLDRQAAGAGRAGPGRQRPAAQSGSAGPPLSGSEYIGHAALQRQLCGQGQRRSGAVPTAPAAGNSLTSASAPTAPRQPPAASPEAQKPAQDIKSKLASAAQVFLAGQFGTGATRFHHLGVGRARGK